VVADVDGAGALTALYVRLGDELLAVMRPDGHGGYATRWVHHDGILSVRALTDESGVTTDTKNYEAFGSVVASAGTDPIPYGFAGEAFDGTSGLAYHRARWMDPRVGRFLGMDAWRGARISHPGSVQDYSYVYGFPVNDVDPSGLIDAIDVSAATGIGGVLAVEAEPMLNFAEEVVAPVIEAESAAAAEAGATLLEGTEAQVQVLANGVSNLVNWVWSLNPFQRGRVMEQALAPGELLKSPNFPTIDAFVRGVATSIKSINLNAVSYADPDAVVSRLTSYVDALAKFDGARWGNDDVRAAEIIGRQLLLAIPSGATPEQVAAINNVISYAQALEEHPVVVNVIVVQ
jgi:RHS repeat-associated protein